MLIYFSRSIARRLTAVAYLARVKSIIINQPLLGLYTTDERRNFASFLINYSPPGSGCY